MLVQSKHTYSLNLFNKAGKGLTRSTLLPEWPVLYECARFEALRLGKLPPEAYTTCATAEPYPHETLKAPFIGGIAVRVGADTAHEHVARFAVSFFKPIAELLASTLVKAGTLEAGESYLFAITAEPADAVEPAGPARRITVRAASERLPLESAGIDEYRAHADAQPGDDPDPAEMPFFVGQDLVDAIIARTREIGVAETGGVLIGRLCKDPGTGEIFAVATAQLPAEHTQASASALTFTGDTWAAARREISARNLGELVIGWWHSHPAREWCRDCAPEKRENCSLSCFFSEQDKEFHATCCPRAYSVALVVTDGLSGIRCDAYGWRRAEIVRRGIHVMPAATAALAD